MNHDYAHCIDCTDDCPKDCFRAQLVRDLKQRTGLARIAIAWMHFKGTEPVTECREYERQKQGEATE